MRDLDELEALHARTTKGPWRATNLRKHTGACYITAPGVGGAFVKVYAHHPGVAAHRPMEGEANTAFIALAHEALPDLIAEIRRMRALVTGSVVKS